jgi:hypothetical protein
MVRYGIGQSAQVQLVRLSQRASTTSVSVVADGGEVGDLLVDLGDLVDGPFAQVRCRVPAAAGVEQVGDLVEGEAEPLRRLDHLSRATVSGG